MHLRGQGTDLDYIQARRWFEMAAEQGDADAQHNLALMLKRGLGGEPDPVGAYLWFSLSAEQGQEDSQERQQKLAVEMAPGADSPGREHAQGIQRVDRNMRARPVDGGDRRQVERP